MRRIGRRVLTRNRVDSRLLDPWPPGWDDVRDVVTPVGESPWASRAGGSRLRQTAGARCLVATEALDAGGLDQVVAFLAERLPERGLETCVAWARPPHEPQPIEEARL